MRNSILVPALAAGLALLSVSGAWAAVNPAAPNPYPERTSKLLVDFDNAPPVAMADPLGTGENRASTNTDPQFVSQGTKSLKVDMTDVGSGTGWADPFVVMQLPQPVDIQGYQVLTMDVFIPGNSLNNGDPSGGWFQIYPRVTVTNPGDDTMTSVSDLPMRQLKPQTQDAWNHLVWDLRQGTDTKVTQIAFATGTSGSVPYSGPIYLSNIRVYKGSFVGLQPDEQLISGFDNPTDSSLFTVGDAAGVAVNTDKQFITQGAGSLQIDLTGQPSGYDWNIADADNWGTTVDLTNATAIHLDIYVPASSAPTPGGSGWHQFGYRVETDGGELDGDVGLNEVIDDQWNTIEIPISPDQAATLGNVSGIHFGRNAGDMWNGPVYVDALRAVVPTTTTPPTTPTPAPTAGG